MTTLGGRLRLVAASRSVTRPLQVTGADALFDTYDDVASALAAEAKVAEHRSERRRARSGADRPRRRTATGRCSAHPGSGR